MTDARAVTVPAAVPELTGVLEILSTEVALPIGVAVTAALPDPIEVAVPRGLSLTNAVSDGATVPDRLATPLVDAAIDSDIDELGVTDGAGSRVVETVCVDESTDE